MKEVTNVEVAEVLEEAVRLYESGEYGWVKGMYLYAPPGQTPKRCFLGILDIAAFNVGNTVTKYDLVHPEIVKFIISKIGSIPLWNDHPERTLDQVIELLKTTAKDLRNAQ